MTGPVVRLVLQQRRKLKTALDANHRLLAYVARQDSALSDAIYQRDEALALVVDLRRDLAALEEFVSVLTPKEA